MSIMNNNKKGANSTGNKQKNNAAGNSKFIKSSSKSQNVTKKIRSTGANRGS